MFADPDFDGDPARLTEEELDDDERHRRRSDDGRTAGDIGRSPGPRRSSNRRRRSGANSTSMAATSRSLRISSTNSTRTDKQLRVVRYTDYAAEKVRTLCPSAPELRARWADPHSAPRSSNGWPNGAWISRNWPKPPGSRRPTPSICSATSPSTPRSHPPGTGPAAAQRAEGLLRPLRPRGPADSGRAAREVCGARRRPVRPARCPQGAAHLRPRPAVRDHPRCSAAPDQLRHAVARAAEPALRSIERQ